MIKRRLIAGLGANALGKVWVIAVQIFVVPALLTQWGTRGYGEWLMLSTLPSYIALSDFGFGTAAGVVMINRWARGDVEGVRRCFHSLWTLVGLVSAGLIFIVVIAAIIHDALFTKPHWWPAPSIFWAAGILVLYSTICLQTSVISVGYRAVGKYARGTFLMDLLLPAEAMAVIGVAFSGGGYVWCASAMTAVRAVGTLIYRANLAREAPSLTIGFSEASMAELRDMLRPAAASLGLPLVSAIGLQGLIFMIGLAMGPAAAGTYGAMRTITRVPLQVLTIVTRATLPEMTLAQSTGETSVTTRLVMINGAAYILIFGCTLLATPLIPPGIEAITHGHIRISPWLGILMSLISAAQAGYTVITLLLTSLNKQQKVVGFLIGGATLCALGPFVVSEHTHSLTQLSLYLLAIEVATLAMTYRTWRSIADSSLLLTAAEIRRAATYFRPLASRALSRSK